MTLFLWNTMLVTRFLVLSETSKNCRFSLFSPFKTLSHDLHQSPKCEEQWQASYPGRGRLKLICSLSALTPVLVWEKFTKTGCLRTSEMYSLMILEVRHSKSRCQQGNAPSTGIMEEFFLALLGSHIAGCSLICRYSTPGSVSICTWISLCALISFGPLYPNLPLHSLTKTPSLALVIWHTMTLSSVDYIWKDLTLREGRTYRYLGLGYDLTWYPTLHWQSWNML